MTARVGRAAYFIYRCPNIFCLPVIPERGSSLTNGWSRPICPDRGQTESTLLGSADHAEPPKVWPHGS